MKILNFILKIIIIGGLTMATTLAAIDTNRPPLIPRKILFSNPDRAVVSLSPDGTKVAYLAPKNNVMNVWVADIDNLKTAKCLTKETQRDLRSYFWSYNNKYLLYIQDQNGNENFHLYSVDLMSGIIKDLTPFSGVRVEVINMSPDHPDEVLIGLNQRDPKWHDVYKLNIVSGKLDLIEENNQFGYFIADANLKLKIAEKPTKENAPEFYFKTKTGKWKLELKVPFQDALTTSFVGINHAGNIAYLLNSKHRDKAALFAYNLTNKYQNLLASDNLSDIDSVLVHPTELTPQAYTTEYEKTKWTVLDKRIKKDFAYLAQQVSADFTVVSRSQADNKWIVRYYFDTKPSQYYLYTRDTKTNKPLQLTFLFTSSKKYENLPLVPMRSVIIKAQDGLSLVSYLTLPEGVKTPVPMVLLVHGGPWARDSWGLDREHQWLANRGYAVLSVNYRGSTGFGKKFVNAGNMEWGRKMHSDLLDAVNWAIKQKIADPKKIAIMGGSYGGYATLVGLTFTPDVFCAGVSIVGPTNLYTLIKTIPSYWEPDIALFKKRVGDIDTEKGRELLHSRSPQSGRLQLFLPVDRVLPVRLKEAF